MWKILSFRKLTCQLLLLSNCFTIFPHNLGTEVSLLSRSTPSPFWSRPSSIFRHLLPPYLPSVLSIILPFPTFSRPALSSFQVGQFLLPPPFLQTPLSNTPLYRVSPLPNSINHTVSYHFSISIINHTSSSTKSTNLALCQFTSSPISHFLGTFQFLALSLANSFYTVFFWPHHRLPHNRTHPLTSPSISPSLHTIFYDFLNVFKGYHT